jgi:hypothetical protein
MSAPEPVYEDWAARYERADWLGRAKLLGGAAVRLTANLIDRALDRTATLAADAERAFRGEVDPNVSEAKILEEVLEPRRKGASNDVQP